MKDAKQAILFANTLWFIVNFKLALIDDLKLNNYEVTILYLRKGGVVNKNDLNYLKKKSIKIITFYDYCKGILFSKRVRFPNEKSNSILMSFTIGPLFLSILPIFNKYKRFATLEGLGRLFASRAIHFRIMKRIVEILYRYLLFKIYSAVFVLNYTDYAYLLEHKLIIISKLFIIPGTGIDSKKFNPTNLNNERRRMNILNSHNELNKDNLYITYIGRISAEKGFYRFIAAIFYLINDNSNKKYKFRIVSPKSDIENLDSIMKKYLISNKIKLCSYTEDPFEFYVSSLIIVIPTLYAEGLSRVALEAGLLGVPIASVSNRGITALFMDGILGEYTLDKDPYGISKIIQKIHINYSNYCYLSPKVFNCLSAKYDNNTSSNVVLSTINKILQKDLL